MIQFNLLPDVKIEYVKAMRTKRMVVGTALIVTASTLAIFLLLALIAYGVQTKSMNDLSDDIKTKSEELKATPDLDKVLTIQNQLSTLGGLHDEKVVSSRIFTYIQQLTPSGVTISDYLLDFEASTITITGAAPALDRVNVFTDTLKYSKYISGDSAADSKKAFSDVVLAQFGKTDEAASYTISMTFDPALFSGATSVGLSIPKGSTTNSTTAQPTEIFKKATPPPAADGQEN